jgi:hypothetical protein
MRNDQRSPTTSTAAGMAQLVNTLFDSGTLMPAKSNP